MKPEVLEKLIIDLRNLPGITKKMAEKIAYQLIDKKKDEAKELQESISEALDKLHKCETCGHITDEKICNICQDNNRVKILVIVENSIDVFKFEDAQPLKPYYHVLGGLINISKNIEFEDLNIGSLKKRLKNFKEVIIALSPNLEGLVTANILKEMLQGIKVTQLAQGIPLGAAMEYVDELTLKAAIENRKEVK